MRTAALVFAAALAGYAGTNAWTPLGPYGGSITTLAADPMNPGTLYAATGVLAGDGGKLYKTTDGGASWTRINSAFGAASIAIDPQNAGTVYVGLRGLSPGAWILKSTDGGASFSLSNSGLEAVQLFGALTVDLSNPDTLYVAMIHYLSDPCATSKGCAGTQVFKSMNAGASWTAVGIGLPPLDSYITAIAVDPQDSSIVYAGLYGPNGAVSGIFKSTDAGANWRAINSSVTVCCTYTAPGLLIDPLDHDTLYAVSFGAVVRFSSAGTILSTAQLTGGNVTSLAIDPKRSGVLYAGTEGSGSTVFKSNDGGITWTGTGFAAQGYGNSNSLAVDPSSGTVYASSIYGVLKSTDGGVDWMQATYGLGAVSVRSVAVDPEHPGTLYALSDNPPGVFKTVDGGKNWTPLRGLETASAQQPAASLLIDPRDSNRLYATSNRTILKSVDGGATWLDIGFGRYTWGLVMGLNNPDTLYALAMAQPSAPGCCRTDIVKSTDGGMNWSVTATLGGNAVTMLTIDPRDSATLYAAGTNRSTIARSSDDGVTWSESALPAEAVPTDDDDLWAIVRSVAVDPQRPNVVYVTGSGGIFKSTDGGVSWTTMNSGLAPYVCTACAGEPYRTGSLVIDPQRSTLYMASAGLSFPAQTEPAGILMSTDGASSWSQVNRGLPDPPSANSLALDPGDPSTLYAAGTGIYTITFAPEVKEGK